VPVAVPVELVPSADPDGVPAPVAAVPDVAGAEADVDVEAAADAEVVAVAEGAGAALEAPPLQAPSSRHRAPAVAAAVRERRGLVMPQSLTYRSAVSQRTCR
jgi:hypothetical protein